MSEPQITIVFIRKEPIRLSQFLKLANIVQDGVEAKIRITEGNVHVNEKLEVRRGRKLYNNDTVQIGDVFLQVQI